MKRILSLLDWRFSGLALRGRHGPLLGLAFVLSALTGLVACGESAAPEPTLENLIQDLGRVLEEPDHEKMDPVRKEILARIAARGQADPAVIDALIERLVAERAPGLVHVIRLEVDYRESGLASADREADLKAVVACLGRRRRINFPRGSITIVNRGVGADGIGRIDMQTPRAPLPRETERTRMAAWLDVMTEPGTVELWFVAEPPSPDLDPPSLWTGDRASYDAFVARHQPTLEQALADGRLIQAGDGRFRLCVLAPAEAGAPLRQIVLVQPRTRHETFDAGDFELDAFGDETTKANVLQISLRRREPHFRDWLAQGAGRRMALLVNGRAELVVPVPPKDTSLPLTIAIGSMDERYDRAWIRGIIRASRPGWIRHPISGQVEADDPKVFDTPVAQALVAVGMPALEAVQALQAKEGGLARRARWISEQIVKTQTGTGTGVRRP